VHLFEPSLALEANINIHHNLKVHRCFFPQSSEEKYDAVILKQVLEHVCDPIDTLTEIYNSLNPNGLLYLEIPSYEWILKNLSIVDFHYQHIHYFNNQTVRFLLAHVGFTIVEEELIMDGHDLAIRAIKQPNLITPNFYYKPNSSAKQHFLDTYNNGLLTSKSLRNKSVVLYGAVAYMQAFIGLYGKMLNQICLILDDNPASHNKHVFIGDKYVQIYKLTDAKILNTIDAVIICSYLHDKSISRKLSEFEYRGQIYTLRPKSCSFGETILPFF
jgi:SAM-dependent methyltransferase